MLVEWSSWRDSEYGTLFVAGWNTVRTAHSNIFFRGWDDNLFRVFFLLIFLSLFYLTVFIFIYFFNIDIFFIFFSAYFIFIYAFSYFTISKFQSIHYSNLHFTISNSHYKSNFVSSAVSVDSSPLETVSVPSLSLTSLKFTNWLVVHRLVEQWLLHVHTRSLICWIIMCYMYKTSLNYQSRLMFMKNVTICLILKHEAIPFCCLQPWDWHFLPTFQSWISIFPEIIEAEAIVYNKIADSH